MSGNHVSSGNKNLHYIILCSDYSIVKDSNADLTVGNWESKIDP